MSGDSTRDECQVALGGDGGPDAVKLEPPQPGCRAMCSEALGAATPRCKRKKPGSDAGVGAAARKICCAPGAPGQGAAERHDSGDTADEGHGECPDFLCGELRTRDVAACALPSGGPTSSGERTAAMSSESSGKSAKVKRADSPAAQSTAAVATSAGVVKEVRAERNRQAQRRYRQRQKVPLVAYSCVLYGGSSADREPG